MTNPPGGQGARVFLTQADQISLATAREQQTAASVPDTLEVRDDSVVVMQDELASWKRPVQIALAAAVVAAVAWITGAALSRRGSTEG